MTANPVNTIPTTVPTAKTVPRAAKKSEAMAMRVGKRPLHGTKVLVRMAISRSRGDSMMRVEITPAALHPKPMAIVRACLP